MRSIIIKGLVLMLIISSCKKNAEENTKTQDETTVTTSEAAQPFFKLSLAQWSLHKAIQSGEMSPLDFARKANELGFEGVEYVSQLYREELKKDPDPGLAMQHLLETLKSESETYHVRNLVIMIDGEGDLAVTDEAARNQAVENHKKWIDAAAFLGCHSIRVNLFGANDPEQWATAAADGLGKLADYAAPKNINVIVENHGYLSSDAALLAEVMQKVNRP
ncbi:MAG: TIM barrel protein, partial [Sinomicrobium sp.]|nr:TIM barrel protein [Sinomicrobium sp.]